MTKKLQKNSSFSRKPLDFFVELWYDVSVGTYVLFGGIIMFIECVKNNGVPYLRLVQGVRVTNNDG